MNKKIIILLTLAVAASFFTQRVYADDVPVITSVSPFTINFGDQVDILGQNFLSGSRVSVIETSSQNGQTIISSSDTDIRVKIDDVSSSQTALTVVVGNPAGGSNFISNSFPIIVNGADKPQITSIIPSQITFGDVVEITGQHFGAALDSTKGVLFNSSFQSVVSWSDTDIRIRVNNVGWTPGFSQQYSVTVKVRDGSCDYDNPRVCSTGVLVWVSPPSCTADVWTCGDYGQCSQYGQQTRTCTKTVDCSAVDTPSPATSQSCTAPAPQCTSDTWSCGDWSTCSSSGIQSRSCNMTFDCPTASTPSPTITQYCTPPYSPPPQQQPSPNQPPPSYQPQQPSCTADTWSCGDWGTCSLSGVQSRSCRKTVDCPSVETAPPSTDQSCEPANRSTQSIPPSSSENTNQDTILKATVKLICPLDANRAIQGSGTVIDSSGTILTNKHVIDGTAGCLVGFISNYNDEPYFGDRQIADIVKVSSNEDVATLKLRNPQNKILPYIDITKGNSNLILGTKIDIYGYPAKFGTNITYTSGDFSGTNGSYLKTTAIIEHGNSGGGAYLKDGTFVGVPSAVIKGELNALGYILSVNTINAWLGNSSNIALNNPNNNYSRVSSILDNIDLNSLNSLQLVIPGTSSSKNSTSSNAPKSAAGASIAKRMSGQIVLQVQSHGEAWYVHPVTSKRYYMQNGSAAYQMGLLPNDSTSINLSTRNRIGKMVQ